MPDIRIADLPLATGPTAPVTSDSIAIDGLTTRKAPLSAIGDVIIPLASQAEAEAGTNATKRMSPLTTAQSISARAATAAQGVLADGSLQRSSVLFNGGKLFALGNLAGNGYDGVSVMQFMVGNIRTTFLPGGSLGTVYGQNISAYSGGAADDATAPVIAAVSGYNQVQETVTHSNEVSGLFVTDNYSYVAQGSGVFGQGNSRHGGRAWGVLGEAKEWYEEFTAAAGQTTFVVPNGYNSIGAVTSNGVSIAFTASTSPNVVVAAQTLGNIIRVYRANPQNAYMGAEIGVYGAVGNDTANALSGNRVVIGVFGYRQDQSLKSGPDVHIGTGVNIVADPLDTTLMIDRGVNFQGRFATGLDFATSNASFSNFMMRFNTSGAGLSAGGSLLRIGDASNIGRMQVSSGSGAVFGSDTNLDVILTRFGTERLRLSEDGPHLKLAASATPNFNGELVIQATSNTSLTFKYKGTDGVVRSASLALS